MLKKEIEEVLADYKEYYGTVPQEQIPEILYNYYAERYPMEHEEFWKAYNALRTAVEHLPPHLRESVMNAATNLANAQEKQGFLFGVRFGQSLK